MFIPPIDWCPAIDRHVRIDWSGRECAAHHHCSVQCQRHCPLFGDLGLTEASPPHPPLAH